MFRGVLAAVARTYSKIHDANGEKVVFFSNWNFDF